MSDEKDRTDVVAAHEGYLRANTDIDPVALREVWDGDPSNVWFNLSGHTYQGLDHWCKLWEYYRTRIKSARPWIAVDADVRVKGDVAWVASTRESEMVWVGAEPAPMRMGRGRSRSTMLFVRRDGAWRAVHAHFSAASEEPRPGGI
jgi:ketosteroid isomerase-like protein